MRERFATEFEGRVEINAAGARVTILAAIFEPDQLLTLMEGLEEIEAQDPERTRPLTAALLAAHDYGCGA